MPPVKTKEDGTDEETTAFTQAEEKARGEAPEFEPKVKFANGDAEAVVDVNGDTRLEKRQDEFVGLSKEELMKYADDPYWKRIRRILLILFAVIWIGMLVAAIIIIALAPKCPPRQNLEWWQKCNGYEILPKSFKDSNGDGVGDLKGIHEKLEYLRDELDVSAINLGSIYPTSNGEDIIDHKAIDPKLGSLEDFEDLVSSAHKKGVRIIVDFIPNHTSRQHPWFEKSRQQEGNYTDYYVWHEPVNSGVPSNWLSPVDNNLAWDLDSARNQYYLHQFREDQPELNLRSSRVQQELRDILLFWIEKGVDGFLLRDAAYLFESADLTLNEPVINDTSIPPDSYRRLKHIYTTYQSETFNIITSWREILDNKGKVDGKKRLLFVEDNGGTTNQSASFLKYNGKNGGQLLYSPSLTGIHSNCDAACVRDAVQTHLTATQSLGGGAWPVWQAGNDEVSRLATRMGGDDYLSAVSMMLLTLPGTPLTYYGEEIRMVDVDVGSSPAPGGAPQRTPMQWDSSPFAGFTSGNTSWLPVSSDYMSRNVKSEKAVGAGVTTFEVYQNVTAVRKHESFQWGETKLAVYGNIFFFIRQAKGFPGYLVALNFGNGGTNVDFVNKAPEGSEVSEQAVIVATTGNIVDHNRMKELMVGNQVAMSNLFIGPREGVVFEFV